MRPGAGPGRGGSGSGGEGGGVVGYFVRHPTAANLLMLLVVALGLAGALATPRQLFPDVEVPTVNVTVRWNGAGVEQIDRSVLTALEGALARTPGLARSVGTAADNRATLALEFDADADIDRAVAEIETALAGLTTLPDGADPPQVRRGARGERISDFLIHGPADHARLAIYADELRRRFSEAGMTRHWITAAPRRVLAVDLPEAALLRHDLSLREVANAVRDAALATPSGFADRGSTRLTLGEERRTAEALAGVPLRRDAEGGAIVTLGEVAKIHEIGRDWAPRHYVNGQPALVIRMDRQGGRDGIEQLAQARAIMEDYARTLPEGVELRSFRAWMETIDKRLGLLIDNALVGLVIVLVLLWLFLSSRAAFWVAAGIPISLLGALAGMWALGITLNLISVFALIIMLGMIVDDAIVVGEHADALARRGLPPAVAAERAARRMAGPVFAASLTTAIAFGSVLLIDGSFGEMLEDLPLTIALVLAASLFECFVILPAHMAHAGGAHVRPSRLDAVPRAVNRAFEAFVARAFRPFMRVVVRLRYPVLGLAVMLLLETVRGIVAGEPPWRFWVAPERDAFSVNVAMVDTAERADTDAQVAMVEAAVRAVAAEIAAETGRDPLDFVLATVGSNADRGLVIGEGKPARLLGGVEVGLIPAEDRAFGVDEMLRRVREATERHPLAEAVAFRPERGGPAGDALNVQFTGAEPADLKAAAEDLKAAAAAWPELIGLEDTLPFGREELTLTPTPLARHLGFTEESLARAIEGRFARIEAVEAATDDGETRILVGKIGAEATADYRRRALIRTPDGDWAPLGTLAEATASAGFASLRRIDGRLTVEVKGDVGTDDAARAAEIEAALRGRVLPEIADRRGVEWRMAGLAAQERGFLADAQAGFLLGLLGIYAALAWVFGSWTRPLAVLLAIPFGLIGAVQGHVWMDLPLTMFSIVGLLGMAGIIVNDSIVLVTAIDETARRRALIPAVVEATCDRLRPVLLTTLTTVLGLAPMLFETSEQAKMLKPTVVTLVFGLGFGMALVLLVTPALVTAQRDAAAALAALRRALRRLGRGRARRRGRV